MLLLLLLGVDSDHSLCVWLKACSIVSQMCVESSGFVELLLLFIDFMLGFQGFVSHNSTIVSCVKKAFNLSNRRPDYNRRYWQISFHHLSQKTRKSVFYIQIYGFDISIKYPLGLLHCFSNQTQNIYLSSQSCICFQGNFSFLSSFLAHKTH